MKSGVTKRITLPAGREAVWRALTISDLLSAWFGARVTIEARLGGKSSFQWADGRERSAVVEAFEPRRLLVLRWLPFERGPDGGSRIAPPGRIRLALEDDGSGTRLTVEETVGVATDRLEQLMQLEGTR